MKVIIQRASNANVRVNEEVVGQIEKGLVVLVGIAETDTEKDVQLIADKMVNLRIFEDENHKMNHSLLDVDGDVLSISQFTLYGDVRKGRRPSFVYAADPDKAEELYYTFNQTVRDLGVDVETGQFAAMMEVDLINQGPVTLILETKDGRWMDS